MENINIKEILNTYKMFSKRQSEILGNLAKKKEYYTFDDLQKELQEDPEAKELLQKIRLIVNGEYKKAGVYKSESNSKPKVASNPKVASTTDGVEKIELFM